MSPTREVWKPLRAKTRTAASRNLAPLLLRARRSLGQGRRRVVVASRRASPTLGGMLVVDLTRYLPGAFASSELLRLGARVVRVEPPGGDPMRARRPGLARRPERREGVGRLSTCRSELDLARALLARADVVLESFRPGVAERLGIGPVPCRTARSTARSPASASAGGTSSAPATTSTTSAGRACSRHRARRCRRCRSPTSPARSAPCPRSSPALLARDRTGEGSRRVVSMTHGSRGCRCRRS